MKFYGHKKTYNSIRVCIPKNGTSGIYHKVYSCQNNYVIAIDFNKGHIEYGDKIIAESRNHTKFFSNQKILWCSNVLIDYLSKDI